MTNIWPIIAIFNAILALIFAGLATWTARKALEMARAATFWQRQAGDHLDKLRRAGL